MESLKERQLRMTELHIGTKTNDVLFHKTSAEFYETLFEVWHQIAEKSQDIGIDSPIDCEVAKKEAYSLLMETKNELEDMINKNEDMGMDNLLR
jgi:DNA-binding ferritin-like protein